MTNSTTRIKLEAVFVEHTTAVATTTTTTTTITTTVVVVTIVIDTIPDHSRPHVQ